MTAELVIVTPEVAPGSGGVADHTLALLGHWGPIDNLIILAADLGSIDSSAKIKPLARSRHDIASQLPAQAGTVFVQYSAYGYDRFGYPRDLLRALVDWKCRTAGRLVVMFHEIWAFWSFTNKNFFVQQLHRRSLKQLLEVCDVAFTTTQSQADHLRRLGQHASVQVVPVGSNIRPNRNGHVSRVEGCAVLFGLQSGRIRTLEKMQNSLTALAGSGRIRRLVSVGQSPNPEASARERVLLAQLNLPNGFEQPGPATEQAVSQVLSAAEFGLFGQNVLSCTKSGSFMAYAAHQLNVIADFVTPSATPPVCWLVSPGELLGGIENRELDRRAECLRMWQEENCSWDVIATKIGRALAIETKPETA